MFSALLFRCFCPIDGTFEAAKEQLCHPEVLSSGTGRHGKLHGLCREGFVILFMIGSVLVFIQMLLNLGF